MSISAPSSPSDRFRQLEILQKENTDLRTKLDIAVKTLWKVKCPPQFSTIKNMQGYAEEALNLIDQVGIKDSGMPVSLAQSHENLRAKLNIAVKALQKQPQIVYETLLEATAWMGIPDEKRENFIKERVENVKSIIDKALCQVGTEK